MEEQRTPLLHRLGEAASELGGKAPRHPVRSMLLRAAVTAVVLGFLVYTVVSQWQDLVDHDVRFHAGWLALAVPALLAFTLSTGLGWVRLLRMLGQRPNAVRAQMAWGKSLLARYVPGGVVFVVTRVLLSEREGVPRRVTVTAIAYETALQFASASVLAAWVLFAHPGRSGAVLCWFAVAACVGTLLCLHPKVFGFLINRALRTMGRENVPALLEVRQVAGMFLYYLATWGIMGAGMVCVTRAIVPVDPGEWVVIASAQALAFCAAVLSLVFPGGLGIRDGAFAWGMRTALPGDSFAIGIAVALTARIGFVITECIYVAVVTLASRRVPGRATSPAFTA